MCLTKVVVNAIMLFQNAYNIHVIPQKRKLSLFKADNYTVDTAGPFLNDCLLKGKFNFNKVVTNIMRAKSFKKLQNPNDCLDLIGN